MENIIELVGPNSAVQLLGVKLVGVNAENGKKLLLTVRFIVRDRGIRELKDKLSREIITAFKAQKIGIASTTFEITSLPELKIRGCNPALKQEPLR